MTGRVKTIGKQWCDIQRGELQHLLQRRFARKHTATVTQSFEIRLGFVTDIGMIDEDDNRVFRPAAGEMLGRKRIVKRCGHLLLRQAPQIEDTHFDLIQICQFSLRFDIKRADRFDLVTKEFDTNRMFEIGRPEIDNTAVNAELATGFDRKHALEA